MLAILKVSGHLYKLPHKVKELMDTIATIIDSDIGIAIVPGGSIFADAVRELQLNTRIDDDIAHWMAVKAMEVYGLFIKGFSCRAIEVYSLDDVYKATRRKLIPIVMPYKILKDYDELPHSWTITSDSISIYIAHLLKADIAILGKMLDGIVRPDGSIMHIVSVDEVYSYAKPIFDEYTPILIKRYRIPLAVFNITKPWILQKIVSMKSDTYTLIVPYTPSL